MKGIRSKNKSGIYLLKVSNKNTRTKCEICSKLTTSKIETPERGVKYEHISHLFLVFLLMTFIDVFIIEALRLYSKETLKSAETLLNFCRETKKTKFPCTETSQILKQP